MERVAKELAALANAAVEGAIWCAIFWASMEFFGQRPPTWQQSIAYVFLAVLLGLLSLFVRWLAHRERRVA